MVHTPSGPPLQIFVQREWSAQRVEDEASEALWPFRFHSTARMHLLGAFPRGTDCLLHIFLELDGECGDLNTFALFDGRAIHPDGPRFRTALVPLSDGHCACAVRINGRSDFRNSASDFHFPLVRLVPGPPSISGGAPHDESCTPALEVAAFFPAFRLGMMTPFLSGWMLQHMTLSVSSLSWLLSRCTFPPFVYGLRSLLLFPSSVTSIPLSRGARFLGYAGLELFPVYLASPFLLLHKFMVIPFLIDRLGIVDARPVFPTQGCAIWAITLPEAVSSNELTSVALAGRPVASSPFCTRVDGRRCRGTLCFHRGIFALTISAGEFSHEVTELQARCQLPVGLFIHTSCQECSTTTTTLAMSPWSQVSASTTTTTSAGQNGYSRVTFYATSGLSQPFVVHAGHTLDCAELLGAATFHFYSRRVVPSMTTWILSSRVFQLANGRWGIFLCTGHGTHEPESATVWIDAGALWPHPYPIHIPSFATWDDVKRRIHLRLAEDAAISVNGIRWDGELRFFANAFVIQIRSDIEALVSCSLHQFADRFTGLLALHTPVIPSVSSERSSG